MEISIENFKSYHSLVEFKFPDGLILIRGSSGSGKSTIFDAISWVLYNYPKNVLPYNIDLSKKDRTYVCLSVGEIKIERWKRVDVLKVTVNNEVLVDDVAQGFINQKFGPLNVWKACSYITQGERNVLLQLSSSERFDLLVYLAFGSDEHILEEYYSKIDQELSILDVKMKMKSEEYQRTKFSFDKKYPSNKFPQPVDGDPQAIPKLKGLYEELKLYEFNRNNQIIIRDTYLKQLKQTETDLNGPEPESVDENLIDQLKKDLTYKDSVILLNRYLSELPKESVHLTSFTEPVESFTEKDLIRANQEFTNYSNFVNNCKKANVKPENLNSEISELKVFEDLNMQIRIRNKIIAMTVGIQKESNGVSIEEIDKLLQEARDRRFEIERSRGVLSCPSCKISLRYVHNDLVLSGDKHIDPSEYTRSLSDVEQTINDLNFKKSQGLVLKDAELLEAQLTTPFKQIPNITDKDLDKKILRYNQLKQLEPKRVPEILPEKIKAVLDQQAVRKTYEDKINRVGSLRNTIPANLLDISCFSVKTNQLSQLIQKGRKYNEYIYRQKLLIQLKSDITTQIEALKIGDPKGEELKAIKIKIEQLEEYLLYSTAKTEVNSLNEELNGVNYKIFQLTEIRKKITEVEHSILDILIYDINFWLHKICEKLFDDPIIVKLELFRTAKTTGRVRPNVHFNIKFRGAEIDNLNHMSGGEGDRLSLALTLALYKVSGSNFLLLDETLSSIDSIVKDSCCSVIRKICTDQGGLVLNILHDTTSGVFDSIINLD